jgi:hypothetical protein
MSWLTKFWNLVGNNKPARYGILAFVLILVLLAFKCQAQPQVWLMPGASFGGGQPSAATLSLNLRVPLAEDLYIEAGPTLWGSTQEVRNNFDWHMRILVSKSSPVGEVGAGIGAAYLQNTDALDGSHFNFSLMLFFRPFHRVALDLIHVSNAGTQSPNTGRQAIGPDFRLR